MLLITLQSEEDVCSKPVPLERKRLSLRNNCLPEQSWKKQIGLQLFDVFSDTARKKSLASGFAFDEAFLLDQRRVFKKYTADRIVEAQTRHFIIKWNIKGVNKLHYKAWHQWYLFGVQNWRGRIQSGQRGVKNWWIGVHKMGKQPANQSTSQPTDLYDLILLFM